MLDRVTFTGIDNFTDINKLISLSKKYSFIEFGCLISKTNTNWDIINRYPSLSILNNLKNSNVNLSVHICGIYARNIVQSGNIEELEDLLKPYLSLFDRIQLNISRFSKWNKNIELSKLLWNKEIIIQTSTDNMLLYNDYKSQKNIYGFQDNSGGKGIIETSWHDNEDNYFGYAGGICLDNVIDVISNINKIRNKPYWIDMETSIRTNDKFDLDICENICKKLVSYKLVGDNF